MKNVKSVKVKDDALFKTIFGTEEGKPMLEILLKDIMQENVSIIEFKDRELPVDNINEKAKIIDLLVRMNGELVHIEVNSRSSRAIRFRNYVYFSKIIVSDQEKGKKYKSDQKYISINLTCSLSKKHDVVEIYKLQDEDLEEYIDNVAIYEVNLDKARELCYNGDKRKDIRHIGALTMTRSDLEIYKGGDEFMENLANKLERMDANDFWYITPEEDEIMILNAEKAMARKDGLEEGRAEGRKQGLQEGRKEGLQEGRKEGKVEGHAQGLVEGTKEGKAEGHAQGLAEGRKQGIQEGKAEGRVQGLVEGQKQSQIEIIKNMLNNGISAEDIAKYTNIDLEIVKKVEKDKVN